MIATIIGGALNKRPSASPASQATLGGFYKKSKRSKSKRRSRKNKRRTIKRK
jgi:hypothetical protein